MRWKISSLFPPEETSSPKKTRARKQAIPARLREAVWTTYMDKVFEGKCTVLWCKNRITVFDFQCGHDIPESKGGATTIQNLKPICARCNLSMGNRYSLEEWNRLTPASEVKVVPEVTPKSCCNIRISSNNS
jgi:5-methylcytosine-specific restriction endonuclease McrA